MGKEKEGKINYKKYINEDEEIRNGFNVTENRKKVWNIELGLFEELKKICEKHNIKYFASGGTMLGAVRHKGFIPWDDDMDFMMFRKDYDYFQKIAYNELSCDFKIFQHHRGFLKLVNTSTTALGENNWWDNDSMGGIGIDIFPVDYASKYSLINKIKSNLLIFLRKILITQKSYESINKINNWTKIFSQIGKFIFRKINCLKLIKIYNKISATVLFKGNEVYSGWSPNTYYPKKIFDKLHEVNFEKTTIPIPDGYDVYLKTAYGDYMEPVIWNGGHNCWYSVNRSYKDIIKGFDRKKTNKENYNNCKDLFLL